MLRHSEIGVLQISGFLRDQVIEPHAMFMPLHWPHRIPITAAFLFAVAQRWTSGAFVAGRSFETLCFQQVTKITLWHWRKVILNSELSKYSMAQRGTICR
jgi:hypothetical protein